jgi:hypothetical protein
MDRVHEKKISAAKRKHSHNNLLLQQKGGLPQMDR